MDEYFLFCQQMTCRQLGRLCPKPNFLNPNSLYREKTNLVFHNRSVPYHDPNFMRKG